MTEEELFLCNAADMLRESIKTFHCSFYMPLLGLNNSYFLNLYKHIEQQSFASLQDQKNISDSDLKNTLFNNCYSFYQSEKRASPLNFSSKQAMFLYDLCQMLNTPFFEIEIEEPQKDPAMIFTQSLWQNYKRNWKAIQPL